MFCSMPISEHPTRRAEKGLKSHQVNFVNISITEMYLEIQNAKVYQAIILISYGMGKCKQIRKWISVLSHLVTS